MGESPRRISPWEKSTTTPALKNMFAELDVAWGGVDQKNECIQSRALKLGDGDDKNGDAKSDDKIRGAGMFGRIRDHDGRPLSGVEVVAISCDTPEEASRLVSREGLSFTVLSDPALEVISAFGLAQDRGLRVWTFTVLGIPLGVPVGRRRMAIPTSLLVDPSGEVLWVDQARDYRLRADRELVMSAVRRAFPG